MNIASRDAVAALVLGGESASLRQPSWFDQWRPHLPFAVLLGERDEQ